MTNPPAFAEPSQGGSRRSTLEIQLHLNRSLPSLSFYILHKDQPGANHFLDSTHPAMADLPPEKAEMVRVTLKTLGQSGLLPSRVRVGRKPRVQGLVMKNSRFSYRVRHSFSILGSGWCLGKYDFCFKVKRGVGRSSRRLLSVCATPCSRHLGKLKFCAFSPTCPWMTGHYPEH